MTDGKLLHRIVVWPTYEDAAAAKEDAASVDCKRDNRLTVWPTYEQAAAHTNIGAGGGGGAPEWVPANAVVHSDFAAGNHWAGNAVVMLGDLWEENLDWSAFDPALVTASGLTNHPNDAAPTMNRTYSAPLLAGDFYCLTTATIDVNASFEMAASELPGYTLHRELDPSATTGTVGGNVQDFADLSEDMPSPPVAYPNLGAVMAVTAGTIRTAINYSAVNEYSVDTIGDPLTDLEIGILGSDNSAIITVTYYAGVPSDATMRTLSLVGTPTAPSNLTVPVIQDFGTEVDVMEAGTWEANPHPEDNLTYQWYRDGVAIDGETNSYHAYVPEDSGASMKVRETATNAVGSASVDSNTITAP
jgi:hypothetical protein